MEPRWCCMMHDTTVSLAITDPMPTPDEWLRLAPAPEKRHALAADIYFRECWADLVAVYGAAACSAIQRLALLSFKPDAIVGRRIRPTLEFCAAHGFTPVGASRFRYTAHSMREVWRDNWRDYSVDRLELVTVMHGSSDTLVLLLKDGCSPPATTAAARLNQLKGGAEPERRSAAQLRERLRAPNRVINFVHAADDSADVVRELGIFLDRTRRRELLSIAMADRDVSDTIHGEVAKLESQTRPHDFDFDGSLDRLMQALPHARPELVRFRDAANQGVKVRWDELRRVVDPATTHSLLWDVVSVACRILPLDRTS